MFLTCSTLPWLGTGRNDFIAIKFFFFFTFLIHIIEYLFIIPTNRWVHCNAYKCPETSAFVALFHFYTRSPWVSLKLRRITKFNLQNRTNKQLQLIEKCSLSNSDMFHISGISGRCMFIVVNHIPNEQFLNRFIWVLVSVLQAAWLFVSVKVPVLSMEHRLDRRTFPPVLGPAVPCRGCLRRCLNHWKWAILFLQDILLI